MYSLVMSELDVVKEKINYLKVWLGIFVVTLISLVGWVVTNYETVSLERLGVSYVAILWLFIFSLTTSNSLITREYIY